MSAPRFGIYFYNRDAAKEYLHLDGSIRKMVNLGYRKLSERADEIGKPLSGKLAGCKELKYRKDGIRIIFRIASDGEVEIVDVVCTGSRASGQIFSQAKHRLSKNPERIEAN